MIENLWRFSAEMIRMSGAGGVISNCSRLEEKEKGGKLFMLLFAAVVAAMSCNKSDVRIHELKEGERRFLIKA